MLEAVQSKALDPTASMQELRDLLVYMCEYSETNERLLRNHTTLIASQEVQIEALEELVTTFQGIFDNTKQLVAKL